MSAPPTASSSRRQSASSSAVSSPMAAEELDGFAAALALQEAAARPGLPRKEVARLLEKVRCFGGESERQEERKEREGTRN